MYQIAHRLHERRKATGLSQGQVAEYEEISQSYLSDLERGRNQPAVWSLLARLATRYRTSADYLIGLTDDPAPPTQKDLSPAIREILIVARQMSEQRQQESLHLMQALHKIEEKQQESVQIELAQVQSLLSEGQTAVAASALVKLLALVEKLSGVDTSTVSSQIQADGRTGM